jgi:2-furoate---CoA ligase
MIGEQTDAALDVAVGEADVSVMLYTAGTTGRPKGVPRSQHAEVFAGLAHVTQARYSPAGESTLCAMPMYHTMGLRSLVSMVLIGGTTAFLPSFSPEAALNTIERERLSALYLVPTAFWALLQEPGTVEGCVSVRKLAYAGAAMTESLTTRLAEAFQPEVFINHYGSTEVYTFAVESDAIARPGSAGRPGLFTRLRVVEADPERRVTPEEPVARGETGEIIASLDSDEAFAGYWQRPDANDRALRDGWYFTGDLGEVDDEGNLRVSGRIDDMVISGGENVHPLEVEDALARCDGVGEVAVAGVPDDRWGHAVTAFVVISGDNRGDGEAGARRIAKWTRAQSGLAAYKRPKRIVILDALPKSPVGKILRRELVAGNYEPRGEATP